jgi:curli biogenesis system outer membrane secretion channel CsgG
MRTRFIGAAVAAALALSPAIASAQAKIKIAIWDFENNSQGSWWFYNDLGPAARNNVDSAFGESDKLSNMFSVIEREKLDLVLKEQGLGASGALDQQTAAKVGQVLGIRYILTGGIDKFSINTTKAGFGGIGGSYTKAEAKINLRFIDTTTAERVASVSAEGNVKKGGGRIKGASLSQEAEWGIASEAIEQASFKVVEALEQSKALSKLSGGGVSGGTEGKIIKVEGGKAWINMGSKFGVSVGDKYAILEVGEALVDPDTGQVLGVDESETGTGTVIEVQGGFSIMTVTGSAKAKSVVRKK